MDLSLERDGGTVLGSLFQQIIGDMKNTSPLWDDFVTKASKLHACLRAAIQAIAAYLDAFQKIADAATNSRGASKEIGTALTRVCLRHKAVETRMKTFTSAIMDCLVNPLQEKLEDWKRHVATIDKDHAKEYKRCRAELKKRSNDTLRLQKKARKGQSDTIQSLVDSHMQDVTQRRAELEEVERKSLRSVMVEERKRYCTFVHLLQPVVKEECEVMFELGHLQEAMQSIANVTKEPDVLPQSSEELILESKSSINLYPESPGGNSGSQGCSNSLGSRKSSVCSISSINSSGSSGSPGHHYQRSLSQLITPVIRLKPGESSDSGFCSSPALTSQASTAASQSHAVSTWPPHSQDAVQTTDRPHTISSAYEKGHQRPALTVYTFQNPETIMESQKSPAAVVCRPPLPVRCSSLERPLSATGPRTSNPNLMQRQCPSPIPAHISKELPHHQPTYVNMFELASMAALKINSQQFQQQQQEEFVALQQQQAAANSHHLHQQQPPPPHHNPQQPPPKPVRHSTSDSNQINRNTLSPPQQQQQQQQQPQEASPNINDKNAITALSSSASVSEPKTILQQTVSSSPSSVNNLNSSSASSLSSSSQFTLSTSDTNNTSSSSTTIANTNDTSTINSTVSSGGDGGDGSQDELLKITENLTIIDNNGSGTTTNTIPNLQKTNSKKNLIESVGSGSSSVSGGGIKSTLVPEKINDITRGSVLEKMSIFEQASKQAAAAAAAAATSQPQSLLPTTTNSNNNNNVTQLSSGRSSNSISSGESIYSNRKDEIYKPNNTNSGNNGSIGDKDQDQIYEDSIQELNNLIGELDSFQREHELTERKRLQNGGFLENPFNKFISMPTIASDFDTSSSTLNGVDVINTMVVGGGGGSSSSNCGAGSLDTDTSSDKLSIGSLNYSTQSTGNVSSNNDAKFTYSDSEISRYVSETSSVGGNGFENPSFLHFNNNNNSNHSSSTLIINQIDNDDDHQLDHKNHSEIMIFDNNYHSTTASTASGPQDTDFNTKNSEIVVLRCKDNGTDDELLLPKQRLSSFRTNIEHQQQLPEKNTTFINTSVNAAAAAGASSVLESPSLLLNGNKPPYFPYNNESLLLMTQTSMVNQRISNVAAVDPSPQSSENSLDKPEISRNIPILIPTSTSSSSSSMVVVVSSQNTQTNLDQRLKQINATASASMSSKPIISPRPASLSGCVTRIARRSSINSAKPPPPVRRSSSVTPSHNLSTPNSPNLIQQNLHANNTNSAETLPPPPAYLLDRQPNNTSPSTIKVAETVKALAAIRHTPASPSSLRRAQQQMNQQTATIQSNKQVHNQTTNNIYSPSPTITTTTMNDASLLGTIYNTTTTTIQHQQLLLQQQSSPKTPLTINTSSDSNYNNSSFRTTNSNSPGIYAQPKQITKMSSFRTPPATATVSPASSVQCVSSGGGGSTLPGQQKPNPSLIAQLNARLTPTNNKQPQNQPVSQGHTGDYGNYQNVYEQQQQQQNQHDNKNPIYSPLQQQQHASSYSSSSPNSPHHNQYGYNQAESLYSRGNERYYQGSPNQQQQQQQHYDDFSPSLNETSATINHKSSGSIRSKTKNEFLENLNAKLAKQGLSGKAFAVRNLINSKALHYENLSSRLQRPSTQFHIREPDPRICHESLMDQIKRGAQLKRNQKINDRSAPKIH